MWLGVILDPKNMCLTELKPIILLAQIMLTVIGSMINMSGETYMTT